MVDLLKPDIVIYEMAERHFNSGLTDAESWTAANAYDNADPSTERGWQAANAAVAGVTLSASVDLSTKSSLSWRAASDQPEVVRLSLLAQGPGQLIVTGSDGATQSLRVSPDSNVLFARLPAGSGERALSISLAAGSAPVKLTSAAVRTARP